MPIDPDLSSSLVAAQLRTAGAVMAHLLHGRQTPKLSFHLCLAAHRSFDAEVLARRCVPAVLAHHLQEFRYKEGDPSDADWFGPVEEAVGAWRDADERAATRPDPLDAEIERWRGDRSDAGWVRCTLLRREHRRPATTARPPLPGHRRPATAAVTPPPGHRRPATAAVAHPTGDAESADRT